MDWQLQVAMTVLVIVASMGLIGMRFLTHGYSLVDVIVTAAMALAAIAAMHSKKSPKKDQSDKTENLKE